MNPQASVIVRSYNRIPALLELIGVLRSQNFDSFEVVVVEQSTEYEESDWQRLNEIERTDPRIKLHKYEPLGGPKARNEGVRNASGDILIFVDDDDLPNSNDWVSKHIEAYKKDESLVGFTGRHIFEGNDGYPYLESMRWFIRRTCMTYSWLKFPYTFAQFDEDVKNVDWLHGTNSSVKKEWALKAGLWDTHIKNQDEHSFAFKLHPLLKDEYHLAFKKEPALIRRMDIEGGMEKRQFSLKREWKNNYSYITKIIFKYFPPLAIAFPIYSIWCIIKVIQFRSGSQ